MEQVREITRKSIFKITELKCKFKKGNVLENLTKPNYARLYIKTELMESNYHISDLVQSVSVASSVWIAYLNTPTTGTPETKNKTPPKPENWINKNWDFKIHTTKRKTIIPIQVQEKLKISKNNTQRQLLKLCLEIKTSNHPVLLLKLTINVYLLGLDELFERKD